MTVAEFLCFRTCEGEVFLFKCVQKNQTFGGEDSVIDLVRRLGKAAAVVSCRLAPLAAAFGAAFLLHT